MKQVIFVFLLLIFTALSGKTLACDCDYEGGFLTVAPNTDLVAVVTVKKFLTFKDIYNEKTPMSMEVEITEVILGEEKRKTIVIWGDNGALCRPYLSIFQEGSSYVMALSQPEIYANESNTDYIISNCGRYWLNVTTADQTVCGDIAEKTNQLTLAELRKQLQLVMRE